MKVCLFSDVHANLSALEAVLKRGESLGADEYICLGDVVGYGPNPNEVVALIQKTVRLTILGNHDNVSLGRENPEHFNKHASAAIEWTRNILNEDTKSYLATLPYIESTDEYYYVHASPKSPADWFYVNSLDEAVEAFEFFHQDFCFIGHTHCPSLVVEGADQSYKILDENEIILSEGQRVLVNVGSVGQPRDRNNKASFAIWYTEARQVNLYRVDYDIYNTQESMREKKLPSFLIHRLQEGR
jgi:diadenosine tetraphosphatase ApaH/serine/threonine PP2A family protein phosphatase